MTYKAVKKLIELGNYDREDMLNKLDVFFLAGRLTQDEYRELVDELNGGSGTGQEDMEQPE